MLSNSTASWLIPARIGGNATRSANRATVLVAFVGVLAGFLTAAPLALRESPAPVSRPLRSPVPAKLTPGARAVIRQRRVRRFAVEMRGRLTPSRVARLWRAGVRVLERHPERGMVIVAARGTDVPRLARVPGVAAIRLAL